jgi:hypothetical protein
MVPAVKRANISRVYMVLLVSAGCAKDASAFLPLPDLCTSYADEVCLGRDACCDGAFDFDVCSTAALEACEADLARLTEESDLVYQGERAIRIRDDLRAELAECRAPFLLPRFFKGPLGAGESCERSTQCASLLCTAEAEGQPMVCTDPVLPPLCEPADT